MDIIPDPPLPDPADPSHPDWVPPEGNLIEVPDYSGIEPDPAPDPGPVADDPPDPPDVE